MDEELRQKLDTIDKKLDAVLEVEQKKERKSRWLLYINIAVIVLPLLGILILLPYLMSSLKGLYTF